MSPIHYKFNLILFIFIKFDLIIIFLNDMFVIDDNFF